MMLKQLPTILINVWREINFPDTRHIVMRASDFLGQGVTSVAMRNERYPGVLRSQLVGMVPLNITSRYNPLHLTHTVSWYSSSYQHHTVMIHSTVIIQSIVSVLQYILIQLIEPLPHCVTTYSIPQCGITHYTCYLPSAYGIADTFLAHFKKCREGGHSGPKPTPGFVVHTICNQCLYRLGFQSEVSWRM